MRLGLSTRRALAVNLSIVFVLQSCAGSATTTNESRQEEGGSGGGTTNPNPPPQPPAYPERAIVGTSTPTMLGGVGGVTDTGAATYTLPLWVPDGPRGMQPALSIGYHGGGGNGHLGTGISLDGIPEITACNRTVASEGIASGINFDASDAYCLDGTKLVEIADPDYPASSSVRVYHTERETFARVIAFLDPTKPQPIRFEVHDRHGLRHELRPRYAYQIVGIDDRKASLDTTRAVAYVYVLVRSTDPDDNAIDYTWEDVDSLGGGEASYRLKSIAYAHSNTFVATRRIQFNYMQGRLDPITRYVHGVKIVNKSRLSSIQMFAPNPTNVGVVWTYNLGYLHSTDNRDSLLKSVQLCGSGGSCSYTRKFEWETTDDKPNEATTQSPLVEFDDFSYSRTPEHILAYAASGSTLNWLPQSDVRLMLFDIDNDGDDDMIYRTRPTMASVVINGQEGDPSLVNNCVVGSLWLRKAHAGTFDSPISLNYALEHNVSPPGTLCDSPYQIANLGNSRVIDLDADGQLELELAKTVVRVGVIGPEINVLDDGTVHAGLFEYGFQRSLFENNTWSFPRDPLPAADLALHGPAAMATWDPALGSNGGYQTSSVIKDPPFQRIYADLDGDGKPDTVDAVNNVDLVAWPGVDWNDPFSAYPNNLWYQAHLSSTGASPNLTQKWTCSNGRARVVDLRGDGRDDVMVTGNTTAPGEYRGLALGGSTPATVDTSKLWGGECGFEPENNPDLVMGDWNGDGLVDALYPPGSFEGNTTAYVRWNMGNGFSPIEAMPNELSYGGTSHAQLRQDAPLGRDGNPVPWDRGTRTADLNHDGRTDLIVFRQDNTTCITDPMHLAETGQAYDFTTCAAKATAFISTGRGFVSSGVGGYEGATLSDGFALHQIADVTGDGAIDIVGLVYGKLDIVELAWRWTPNRLLRVLDSGAKFPLEEFTYTRKWWGDGERPSKRSGGCPYPLACEYRGFAVVREHKVFQGTDDSGAPRWNTTLHEYDGFYADQRGRGSLGVRKHRIWDRERGIETRRYFDNDQPFDVDENVPGGEFYPWAFEPNRVVTITPTSPMPTDAQLAVATPIPGLPASATARIETTEYADEIVPTHGGRIIRRQLTSITTKVGDANAAVSAGAIPGYATQTPTGEISATTTLTHDAYGNQTSAITHTSGGIVSEQAVQYSNNLQTWRLGRATKVAARSSDADDAAPPTEITRALFDAKGRPSSVSTLSLAPGGCSGGPITADCPAAEKLLSQVTVGYDTRGNTTGRIITAPDVPLSRVASMGFDAEGVYPVWKTDIYGAVTFELRHPAYGVPILEQDAIGVHALSTYDEFRRLVSITTDGAPKLDLRYLEIVEGNHRGLKIESASTDGMTSYRRLDERGHENGTGWTDYNGTPFHTRSLFDVAGNVTRAGRPSAFLVPFTPTNVAFDRLGRVTSMVRGDGATTTFSYARIDASSVGAGRIEMQRTDPENHVSFEMQDLDGRLVRTGGKVGVSRYGMVTFTYGPFDRLQTTTDALGNKSQYIYDDGGRLQRQIDPNTGTIDFHYNGLNELVTRTKADGVTTFAYDRLGRLTSSTDPYGSALYEYGTSGPSLGKLVHARSTDNVEVFTDYDSLGRASTTRQVIGGATDDRIVQTYDTVGRPLIRFYPETSGFLRFVTVNMWNANGTLESVDDISACILPVTSTTVPVSCPHTTIWKALERTPDGLVRKAKHSTHVTETRSYDPIVGTLGSVRADVGATQVAFYDYQYDKDGLMKSRSLGPRTETFGHDSIHRLTSWKIHFDDRKTTPVDVATTYDYDPVGNLLEVTRDGASQFSGTYGKVGQSHVLVRASRPMATGTAVTNYAYDSHGRQTAAGARITTWTQDGQPRTISSPTLNQSYLYNHGGERVRATGGALTTTYVGDVYERRVDATGTKHVFAVKADGGTVAQVIYNTGAPQKRYIVKDHLGSAVMVFDGTGLVEQTSFAPFGDRVNDLGKSSSDPDRSTTFGYTGHEEDLEALVNMKGRIYDVTQYRFTAPDRLIPQPRNGQSHNPYNYVLNSPLFYRDPSGFDPENGTPPSWGWNPWHEPGSGGPPATDGAFDHLGNSGGGGGGSGSGGSSGHYVDVHDYSLSEFLYDGVGTWTMTKLVEPIDRPCKRILDVGHGVTYDPVTKQMFYPMYEPPPPQVQHGWKFQGIDEYNAQPGNQIMNILNKGTPERMSESLSKGLQLWGKANDVASTQGVLKAAWKLVRGNYDPLGIDPLNPANKGEMGIQAGRRNGGWTRTKNVALQGLMWDMVKGLCPSCGVLMTREAGPDQMTIDHCYAHSKYGASDPISGTPICRTCNCDEKGDMEFADWLYMLGVRFKEKDY